MEWISVKDDLPKSNDIKVLVTYWINNAAYVCEARFYKYHRTGGYGWETVDGMRLYYVSHWMPLPNPPVTK